MAVGELMIPVDLLTSPRCRAEHLGLPMPDSRHAVSACLPLWHHNIRYEEGDPDIVGRLQAAYPRFCLHPFVRELCRKAFGGDSRGLIFPSRKAAERALEYVRFRGAETGTLVALAANASSARMGPSCEGPGYGVAITEEEFPKLREYWQHAGEVITSRAAELILNKQPVVCSETAARATVRDRLAELRGGCAEDVWLFPSGMAAIAAVWRALRTHDASNPSVQFGFPYVDTLKIQQRFAPADYRLFPVGDASDVDQLESLMQSQIVSAVFCETPTNPLLTSPDLPRLRTLADQYGFLLVVDDTLAACINDNVLPFADIVVTSLTKYFSGYGDVLAGCATLNPNSRHADWLRAVMTSDFEELLPDADIAVLERNSRDLRQRVTTINRNAAILARRFAEHHLIQSVYHPSLSTSAAELQCDGCRCGGLMSIVLRDPENTTPVFFDHLEICKGPNLGTNFTLCCPYTILAHYTELEFVESCGVSRWLLRVSIGTEPVEELWSRFERAFAAAWPYSGRTKVA